MKKLIELSLAAIMTVSASLPVLAENNSVEIGFKIGDSVLKINGENIEVEKPYIAGEGTTLVPIRVISEAFGADVGWESGTKTVTVDYNDNTITLQIGSKTAAVNGSAETLEEAPQLSENGYTMIPLRFISENLGASVGYDNDTQMITVSKNAEEKQIIPVSDKNEKTVTSTLSETDMEALKSRKEIIRYSFEQSDLPQYVFEHSDTIYDELNDIVTFGTNVFELWDKKASACAVEIQANSETVYDINDDITNYYKDIIKEAEIDSESMFEGATCLESENGTRMGIVIFKSADSMVQCKYLGVIASKDGKPRYFTAENDIMEHDKWFFCEVTESGRGTLTTFDKKDISADLDAFADIAVNIYEKNIDK